MLPAVLRPGLRAGFAALLCALLAGCTTSPAGYTDPARTGPFYAPKNFAGDPALPATIRRVVLLPVHAGALASPEQAGSLDQSLLTALQRQARFEVVAFTREDSRRLFGQPAFDSSGALPAGYLSRIAERHGADAVLFVDLTAYDAYRPLVVGFRAKLATAREVRLVWTFDEIISAANPAVANSARRHYLAADRSGQPVDLSQTALQNPARFAGFAADVMFGTLPPR